MKGEYVKTSLLLAVTFVCVVSCTKKTSNNSVTSNSIKGHEFVDLGLSVKWATCNIGADSPSDYGDYFWSEIDETKDVARANWGGTWRMPTKDEIDELIDRCEHTWTTQDGVEGYKITGPNGNSIFLPAAGWRDGTSLSNAGEDGDYWSATPLRGRAHSAYALYFDRYFDRYRFYGTWDSRDHWGSVRPVSE